LLITRTKAAAALFKAFVEMVVVRCNPPRNDHGGPRLPALCGSSGEVVEISMGFYSRHRASPPFINFKIII
jgi:hypothetical protein